MNESIDRYVDDPEILEDYYRHLWLLELVKDSPLLICDDTYGEESSIVLKEIHENAHAVHRARQGDRVVSARNMSIRGVAGFALSVPPRAALGLLSLPGGGVRALAGAVARRTTRLDFTNGVTDVVRRRLAKRQIRSDGSTRDTLQRSAGTNSDLDSGATRTREDFNRLKPGEGPLFADVDALGDEAFASVDGDLLADVSIKQKEFSFEIPGEAPIDVKYVVNAQGNVQLVADSLTPDELGRLTGALRSGESGVDQLVKQNWNKTAGKLEQQDLIRRLTGKQVDTGRGLLLNGKSINNALLLNGKPIVHLGRVLLDGPRDVLNEGFYANVFSRKAWTVRNASNDAAGHTAIGKDITNLGSKATIHLPIVDSGFAAARKQTGSSPNFEEMKALSEHPLNEEAMKLLKATGNKMPGSETTEIEFDLVIDANQGSSLSSLKTAKEIREKVREQFGPPIRDPPIRIKQFQDAMNGAPDDVKDHLRQLEACKVEEMLDPNLNKRLDANGLVDGKDAGDPFDVLDYVRRQDHLSNVRSKHINEPTHDDIKRIESDLEHYGSVKHQFKENSTLFNAPKYKSMEFGLAHKLQMIHQTKSAAVMTKKYLASARWMDEPANLADKKNAFANISVDVCGGATCTDDQWTAFSVTDYYQSAGVHYGNGIPINGTKLAPKMEIQLEGTGFTQVLAHTKRDPWLFSPDRKAWVDLDHAKFAGKSNASKKEQFGNFLYEQTTGNVCKRFPKLCAGAFYGTALGTLGYIASENWAQCSDRWYPTNNALLLADKDDCVEPKACEKTDEGCLEVEKDNPWSRTDKICKLNEDPEKDFCTSELRKTCYQHCLPRNYSGAGQHGLIGSIPAVTAKLPSGQVHASWCMESYHQAGSNQADCKLDISATTNAGIETNAFCMTRARTKWKHIFHDNKESEVYHLKAKMAYPGQVRDRHGNELPWAKDDEWATDGECSMPEYNTGAKMLENLLYHRGCGSIQHNRRTVKDWSPEKFEKDTQIKLPPNVDCDFDSKDFDDLIVEGKKDNGDIWWSEAQVFLDQPYCAKDDDDPATGKCRDYCWNMCSTVSKDVGLTYEFLVNRKKEGQETLFNAAVKKIMITAAIIGAGIVALLLVIGALSRKPSEEEQLMAALE